MAIVYDMTQGSSEWLEIRAGIPTASEFDALITPLWKPRTGEGVETYLTRKLAERWTGAPLAGYHGGAMEQGSIREEEALPFFEFHTGRSLEHVGFITTDNGSIGCSPDALIAGGGGGLECKCPEAHTHVGYLLRGVLPKEYVAQVHGSMLVTGARQWSFLSYCREFPPLLPTVQRDESIIDAMAEAICAFTERLEQAWARLCDLNGGAPQRKIKTTKQPITRDFSLAELL